MRPLVILTIAVLYLCGCADQQSGVSVGGTAPESEPVAELTTGPIPVEPEGGIGDGAGPPGGPAPTADAADLHAPAFGVSSETDSTSLDPYTFCWSEPRPAGGSVDLCSDGPADPSVTLTADAQLVVTYEEGTLNATSSAPFRDPDPLPEQFPLPVEMENPGIWLVDLSGLENGDHAVGLEWNGTQGDSFAILMVTIQR